MNSTLRSTLKELRMFMMILSDTLQKDNWLKNILNIGNAHIITQINAKSMLHVLIVLVILIIAQFATLLQDQIENAQKVANTMLPVVGVQASTATLRH